jgi:hypothetical protein
MDTEAEAIQSSPRFFLVPLRSDVAANADDSSDALKLIEFGPDKEGVPQSGRVFTQFGHNLYELDVKLCMLEPHELAQAKGFHFYYSG